MEMTKTAVEPPPPPAGATGDAPPEVTCTKHGRHCIMFCYENGCNKILCLSCPMQRHSGHRRMGISEKLENSEYFDEKEKEVEEVQEELEVLLTGFEINKVMLSDICENFTSKTIHKTVEDIIREGKALKDQVKSCVETQSQQIDEKQEKVKECLEKGRETLKEMKKYREASAGNIGAVQMQRMQCTFEEFMMFAMQVYSLNKRIEVPILRAEHKATVGRIQTHSLQGA